MVVDERLLLLLLLEREEREGRVMCVEEVGVLSQCRTSSMSAGLERESSSLRSAGAGASNVAGEAAVSATAADAALLLVLGEDMVE